MIFVIPASIVIATFIGGWEVVLILAVLLTLIVSKKMPEIMQGLGLGASEFRKEVDHLAHDAGKSAGGIFGKPAAEALTPENQTAELYDPAVFRQGATKGTVRLWLRRLWWNILKWLRITRE